MALSYTEPAKASLSMRATLRKPVGHVAYDAHGLYVPDSSTSKKANGLSWNAVVHAVLWAAARSAPLRRDLIARLQALDHTSEPVA